MQILFAHAVNEGEIGQIVEIHRCAGEINAKFRNQPVGVTFDGHADHGFHDGLFVDVL